MRTAEIHFRKEPVLTISTAGNSYSNLNSNNPNLSKYHSNNNNNNAKNQSFSSSNNENNNNNN